MSPDKPVHLVADLARGAATRAAAAAYPYVGGGDAVKRDLDDAALDAVDAALGGADVEVVLCEGPRDGSGSSRLGRPATPAAYAYLDPVDGTTNAVRAGPRSFSAVCLDPRPPLPAMRALADRVSVFIAGGVAADAGGGSLGDTLRAILAEFRDGIEDAVSIGSLNRADNLRLLPGSRAPRRRTGSTTGYAPTVEAGNCVFVGDASVPLPWEFDRYFGRVGLVEAVLAAALDPGVRAVPVSRRLLMGTATPFDYLAGLSAAVDRRDRASVAGFYTAEDAAALGAADTTAAAGLVLELSGDRWLSPDCVVCVASLTGSSDPALDGRRDPVLLPLRADPRTGAATVDCLERGPCGIRSGTVAPAPASVSGATG